MRTVLVMLWAGVTLIAVVVGVVGAWRVESAAAFLGDPRIHLAGLLGVLCLAVCLWRNLKAMTATLGFLTVGLVLMLPELTLLPPAGRLLEWGEPTTFAYLFPEAEPLIGPGGRLRPNLDARMVHPEKRTGVRLVTNAAGFRNAVEFPRAKPASEVRVLSLGDSFSTGYRTDQDAFFGPVVQETLRQRLPQKHVVVMNAEISDPATGLYHLQQSGLAYQPDVVLIGLCGNDVMQAYSFVGPGREFALEDGAIHWQSPETEPRIDPRAGWHRITYPHTCERPVAQSDIANGGRTWSDRLRRLVVIDRLGIAYRRVTRPGEVARSWASIARADSRRMPLIDGFPNLGFHYHGTAEVVAPMYETCFAVLAVMRDQCRRAGAEFVVVFHPQRFAAQPQDWEATRKAWCLDETDFDLDAMNETIGAWCASAGVHYADLTGPFREPGRRRQLYLPGGDMHYNEAGHRLAGRVVGERLAEVIAQP